MILKVFLRLVFASIISYSLFFGVIILYEQPKGAKSLFDAYLYGLILHLPVWLLCFGIGLIILKALKIRVSFKFGIYIMFIAILLLFCPVFFREIIASYDYISLIFYGSTYLSILIFLSSSLHSRLS